MQTNNKKYRLRVTYKKCGKLSFLSHLELIRAIEKTVRRSGLPYAVSQGFSPHMKISFCAALSLGIESKQQLFDVYLTEYVNPKDALLKLKKASVNDLCATECKYVDNKEASLGSLHEQESYRVVLDREIDELIVPNTIIVNKKNKEKIIDVTKFLVKKPILKNINTKANISFVLSGDEKGSLNPVLFVQHLLKKSNSDEAKIILFEKF